MNMSNRLKLDPLSRANLPDQERFDEMAKSILSKRRTMKNCYVAKDFRPQVKIFFGGAQHVILSTTWRFVVPALRIADAAVLYFWKYRKLKRQPADEDFNFSYDTAKSDVDIPFIKEMFEMLELRLNARGKLPEVFHRVGRFDLQPSRIRMMQTWAEFRELFKQMYFQCPNTPKTEINLKYAKQQIESLDNLLRSVNVTVRDVANEAAAPSTTTAAIGEASTAVIGEPTTPTIGEPTTPTIGEPTTAAIGVPLGDVIPTHTQRGDDMFQK